MNIGSVCNIVTLTRCTYRIERHTTDLYSIASRLHPSDDLRHWVHARSLDRLCVGERLHGVTTDGRPFSTSPVVLIRPVNVATGVITTPTETNTDTLTVEVDDTAPRDNHWPPSGTPVRVTVEHIGLTAVDDAAIEAARTVEDRRQDTSEHLLRGGRGPGR